MIARRVARGLDDRLGGARWARSALGKIFPDHFSFMLGEVALYCFVVLVATGVFLTFFFEPSLERVTYEGSYEPLRGVEVTAAYRSALDLSFDVRAGLLMRQVHHWAALVFLAAIVAHVGRLFFTGAFRKPREVNWVVGVTLLVLSIANGFAGYSLLDDLLSGTGLRIAYSLVQSIPVAGNWLAHLTFGGPFPGEEIISRLFVLHILLLPAAIVALISVHLALLWHQKHTQFPGPGRSERNIVGSALWPTYAAKSLSLFLAVAAVLTALGGVVQINPVWLYGPYEVSQVTTAAQPDWYVGWLEGALRLFPAWEPTIFGHLIPNPFFPAVLLPTVTFVGMYAYPWAERWLTKDRDVHHLLDRPRDRPWRTAFGAGALAFYTVLFLAGGQDVIATVARVSVNAVAWTLRVLLVVLPGVVAVVAYRWCIGLRAGSGPPLDGGEPPG